MLRLKIVSNVFLVILMLGLASPIYAHPHNWIELNTTFVLDQNAGLTQVKQRWEFDVYYSMMTRADLLNEFSNEEKGLVETARRMINSLKDYDYFSRLRVGGLKVNLGMPEEYRLYSKKKVGSTVLVLEMAFEIEDEIKFENKAVAWQVFDPTYYIAMNHDKESNVEIITSGATECSKTLETPEPSDETIEYAQSLDKDQKNTDGLGERFAENILINCI
jgi:ABC-type uncharacterized transport system substrate-binding protein